MKWFAQAIGWTAIAATMSVPAAAAGTSQLNSTIAATRLPTSHGSAATSSVVPQQLYGALGRTLPLAAGSRLSLQQAISIALKYHPRAAVASAETSAAQEQVGEARSYLGPQISGLSEYLRSTDNGIGDTSFYNLNGLIPRIPGRDHDLPSNDFSQNWTTSNNYIGGVGASQYLLDFGRRRGFLAERRYEAAAAGAQQQMVDLQLIFEVSQRYFNLLQTRQLIRVYQQAVEQRRYHLHEAQVKANAGLRPQLDVYLTEAELERAQLHLVDAHNAADDAVVALDNALGLGGMSPNYQLVDVLSYEPVTASLNSLLSDAIRLRPDMMALTDQARAMGAQITQARSDYFPRVNAVAGYSAMGTGLPAANNFNVGIVISWPIFNSFMTTHQVAEARFRQRALQSEMQDLQQHIILQVKTAFLDWQASLQRIRRVQRTLAASRAELELAEKRYQTGLADIVELEDAQRNYTADDAAYANARYAYSLAKAAVDEASGRSLGAGQ